MRTFVARGARQASLGTKASAVTSTSPSRALFSPSPLPEAPYTSNISKNPIVETRQIARFASTSSKPVPVDVVLRKFFRKVHPDLFASDPHKKKVNSESFAKLNNYLDNVKTQNWEGEQVNRKFDLTFFLKADLHSEASGSSVTITVFPPAQEEPTSKKKRHLHKTLVQLFEACKFEYEPFDVEGYGAKDEITERYAKPGDLTLVKFLMSLNQNRGASKEAKAAFKVAQEKEEKLVKDLNALSLLLAKKFGIASFAFEISEHVFMTNYERAFNRLTLLNHFNSTLSKLDKSHLENLKGATIVFAKRTHVDPKGRLVLDYIHEDSWQPFFENLNPAKVKNVISDSKRRADLEAKVAQLLKISRFYSDPELSDDYTYEQLLRNSVDYFTNSTEVIQARPDVKIRVSTVDKGMLEVAHGCMVVPISTRPVDLPPILKENGTFVQGQFNVIKETVLQVKNTYGLGGVTFLSPPDLTTEQIWETLNRLLNNHSRFAPYLSNAGMRLHIAKDYGYSDKGIVCVRWDFLVDA